MIMIWWREGGREGGGGGGSERGVREGGGRKSVCVCVCVVPWHSICRPDHGRTAPISPLVKLHPDHLEDM